MIKEFKIVLPFYKIAYAVSFTVILSLIRGVTYTYEIGIAMEAPMAMLAAVFCADTYTQEMSSKRSEIYRLYPLERRVCSLIERLFIQAVFLLLLAIIGYGLFVIFQKPFSLSAKENETELFLAYLIAIIISIIFWDILSNTLSCFFRNMWMGIGGCLLLWMTVNSTWGDKYLGAWNVFSYSYRNIDNRSDFSWIGGKFLCIGFSIIMLAVLPKILKKRG